ncbi:MAG: biotin--[acetyl-CoA-carboxylase] ligase [Chitinophagaceae bacterium]|nr:biotin--[acetyl-CoA-carboxylase] ligase [Chitinophagaceae bacterium]
MINNELFVVLDSVDSTNNYAMAQIRQGLAKDGMIYFAKKQTKGKGQRGKIWQSVAGENIAMSLVVAMDNVKIEQQFELNMVVSLVVQSFFKKYDGENTKIKWPNDIYWRDRKAGGILIENIISGTSWKWAVIGIGLNINQEDFEPVLKNPVSLKLIAQKNFDVEVLAKELHRQLLINIAGYKNGEMGNLLNEYNANLFKKDERVKLKKGNVVFETTIKGVTPLGVLQTADVMEREFTFGEVEWVL